MRWLLLKDLQILRRSPLLTGLLVVYPIAIALLIGLALSRSPDKPSVAFLNEVPPGGGLIDLGDDEIDASKYAEQFFKEVKALPVNSRAEAREAVESGDALAALIVPADIVEKLSSQIQAAEVEVLYNGDALKQGLVEATIDAQLARANAALADKLKEVALDQLGLLFDGGRIVLPFGTYDLVGLRRAQPILLRAIRKLPRGAPERAELERVRRFAALADQGAGVAAAGLKTVSRPVEVKRTVISGGRTPLDAFAIAIAVTVSLMFVCVLLAAGTLALEREEQAFGRLVRGLVSRTVLLAEKIVLAAACSFAVALAMLCGIALFVDLDWGRFGQWVVAIGAGALGFAALGVAIGALAREVRVASLLAFLLSLPLAFLALVPSGAVAGGLYDAIRVVSAVFPFKPALQAMDAATNDAQGGLAGPLLHLLALTAGFALLARLALRRF